jgi:hypothetical protein
MLDAWGQGTTIEFMAPRLKDFPYARQFMGRYERMCVSPRAGWAHLGWVSEIDVRPIARTLHLPTLVMHRTDDALVPVGMGRALAGDIPGARYIELPGDEHPPWIGDAAALVAEIQQFLTGSGVSVEVERVLATVLFTDIVGSTERAVALGDRAWRALLDRHYTIVHQEIERHAAARSIRAATAFSPPSTARPGQSGARGASEMPCGASASRSAPASIPASASASATRSPGSPSIRGRASWRRRGRAKSWCRAR